MASEHVSLVGGHIAAVRSMTNAPRVNDGSAKVSGLELTARHTGLRLRVFCALSLGACVFLIGPAAQALSLGSAEVASGLGQPLSLIVPIAGDEAAKLSSECIRVVRPDDAQDGVAAISGARASVFKRESGGLAIRVQTPFAINEPAARVVLEAGCETVVRRDFTVLLDPVIERKDGAALQQAASRDGLAGLDFGAAQVTSSVGQPLSMRVPLIGTLATQVAPECVRVIAVNGDTDGSPAIATGGATLVRNNGQTAIRVTTAQPLNEASIRVILEAGCDVPLRREFGLLLDLPTTALASNQGNGQTVVPAEPLASAVGASAASRSQVNRAILQPRAQPQSQPQPPIRPRPAVPVIAARQSQIAPSSESMAAKPGESRAASIAAPLAPSGVSGSRDRLKLSPGEPVVPPVTKSGAAPASPPATALPDAAVIQRVRELEAEVQKMRAELQAAVSANKQLLELQQNGTADGPKNRELALARQSERIAWVVAAVALLLMLGGVIWLWRQRRSPLPDASPWYETAVSAVADMGRGRARREGREARAAVAEAEAAAAVAQLPADMSDDDLPSARSRTIAASETIQVTELRDAQQLLNELDVIRESRGATRDAANAVGKSLKLDLDLSAPRPALRKSIPSPMTDHGIPFDLPSSESGLVPKLSADSARTQGGTASTRTGPTTFIGNRETPLTSFSPEMRTALHVDVDLDNLTSQGANSVRPTPVGTTSSASARPLDFDLQLPSVSDLSPAAQKLAAAGKIARGRELGSDLGAVRSMAATSNPSDGAGSGGGLTGPASLQLNTTSGDASPATLFAELSALATAPSPGNEELTRGAGVDLQEHEGGEPTTFMPPADTQIGPIEALALPITPAAPPDSLGAKPQTQAGSDALFSPTTGSAATKDKAKNVNITSPNTTFGSAKTQLMVDHNLDDPVPTKLDPGKSGR